MVSIKCADPGFDCKFEAKEDNAFDIEQKIAVHAREAHGKQHPPLWKNECGSKRRFTDGEKARHCISLP